MPALENPRWERFCHEYLKSGNATAAYQAAGYKRTPSATANAARLITNDKIKDRLSELGERTLSAGEVDLQWWLTRVKAAADLPSESTNYRDKIAAVKAAMPALDLIAQHLGALKPKQHEISGPGGAPIATESLHAAGTVADVAGMSDEELRSGISTAATPPMAAAELPPAPP